MSPAAFPLRRAAPLVLAALAAAGCRREERRFETPASAAERPGGGSAAGLVPGLPGAPGPHAPGTPDVASGAAASGNAYEVSEGKRLYVWFNCAGCHGHGGGGDIGPPLLDAAWKYGSEPREVYESIVHGRPDGMPAFGGKIPEQQVWQLVAYVRSMSGLTPMDTRSARSDSMSAGSPESLRAAQPPRPEPPVRQEPVPGKKR
jgi:cytochrome c oxidase cbb3-type subunit III